MNKNTAENRQDLTISQQFYSKINNIKSVGLCSYLKKGHNYNKAPALVIIDKFHQVKMTGLCSYLKKGQNCDSFSKIQQNNLHYIKTTGLYSYFKRELVDLAAKKPPITLDGLAHQDKCQQVRMTGLNSYLKPNIC